jgi:hypothetical protein
VRSSPVRFPGEKRRQASAMYTGADRVRLRILKSLDPWRFEPFDVRYFEPGQVYEIGPRLAELLILEGCAEVEQVRDRAADHPRRRR